MTRARRGSRVGMLLAAVLATVVIGYFVTRQLSWRDLAALRQKSDPVLLGSAFLAYACANLLRAMRFRALTGDRIPTRSFLRTVIIQNLLNTFLPLRAGEASYLYMVHRTGTVKPSDNLGSLLGARVLDLLAALLLPVLALPLSRAWQQSGLSLVWVLLPPVIGLIVAALGLRYAETMADFISARATTGRPWLNRLLTLGGELARSIAQLRRASLLGRVTLLTGSCWMLIYASGYFALLGIGLELGFFDAVFAYSFPVVASMMPFFMLGGFGVYEGSLGMGLKLVGVPLGLGTAASLALHVAELSFIVLQAPFTLIPQLWPELPEPPRPPTVSPSAD